MQKLKLIIGREYFTRVKSKSFILITILVPLSVIAFIGITAFISTFKSDKQSEFVLIDQNNILDKDFTVKGIDLSFGAKELSDELANFDSEKHKGIIYLGHIDSLSSLVTLKIYSDKTLPVQTSRRVQNEVKDALEKDRINQLNLSDEVVQSLSVEIKMEQEGILDKETKKSDLLSGVALGLGGFMGMLMYFFIFFYGAMVMKSVMEEKTNRIIEVIISSVSPTQLMLGKILGVGLVALTQIMIWIVLVFIIEIIAVKIMGFNVDAEQMAIVQQAGGSDMLNVFSALGSINWLLVLPMFILYFIGGYLLYAALFAAVGSAVGDASGDNQTMTLPIAVPIMIGMFLMLRAVEEPEGSLAFFSSIIPLFSPLVMPSLLPFDPPIWQLILSLVVLYGTAYFFIWLAGRIYRVGILLYGKKIKAGEMLAWLFKNKI